MQNELEKGIMRYVDSSIENAPYTQIYTGLIKASDVDGYTIDLNGVEYTNVPSKGSFSTNDTVKVVIPNNQPSNMFILAESTGGGGTGAVSSVNGMTGDVVISNVASANKLSSAKTITLSGDVAGSVSFDGSANVSITSTVVDDSHNHVISNVDNLQTTLDSKLNSSAYNATDVLTKIKTVDGSGSGLDADTVDTYHVNNTLNTGSLWTSDKILSTVEAYGSHFDRLSMARNRLYAGTNGIYGNQLIMQKTNGQWESLTSTHSSGTSKTKNASGFLLSNILLYTLGATVTSGNLTDTGNNYVSFDNHTFQYSSNCGTTLTAYKSLYLKGTIVNGLFYLADVWYSQTLPTSDDGYVYVYLGETVTTSQFSLYPTHPIYKYVNGYLRNVTDYSLMSVGITTSIEWN